VNPETVDSEYSKLEQEAGDVAQAVSAFSQKLQDAAAAGDNSAREWLLDLKSIALQIQQEQLQMQSLLQAMHDFTMDHLSGASGQQPQYAPQPAYAAQPGYGYQQAGAGGLFSRFCGGGFGRAIAMGAGFGIGDDIINHIL